MGQGVQIVWDDAANTCGNPCPVVDQKTGTVWLLMTHNLGGDAEAKMGRRTEQGRRTVRATKRADDGATWDRPVEITRDAKRPDWTWYATGPGVGIQLKSGRLLIPCDHKADKPNVREVACHFQRRRREEWKLGGIVGPDCNECQTAELSDGRVLLDIRATVRKTNRRLVAVGARRRGDVRRSRSRTRPWSNRPVRQA